MIFVNTDGRVGAVTGGCAGKDAGQALEIRGCVHGIAQCLARDDHRSVRLLDGHFLDGSLDHVEGIIGMSMEDADRCLAELGRYISPRMHRRHHR